MVDKLRATPASVAKAKGISEAELLAKLVRLWGDPPKRSSRRDPSEHTVAISMGIDGVGPLQGAIPLAEGLLSQHGDVEKAVAKVIAAHSRLVAASGFGM